MAGVFDDIDKRECIAGKENFLFFSKDVVEVAGPVLCAHRSHPPGSYGFQRVAVILSAGEIGGGQRSVPLHKDAERVLIELDPKRGDYIILKNLGKRGRSYMYEVKEDVQRHQDLGPDIVCVCQRPRNYRGQQPWGVKSLLKNLQENRPNDEDTEKK